MMTPQPHSSIPLRLQDVSEALQGPGYYWLASDTTLDEFRQVSNELGEVFYEADVRMGAERPRNYQLPAAIDFHTDHVSAEIAAWYCVEQDSSGGAMQFLDLAPVAARLSDDELAALSRVRVPDNAVWAEGGDIPLCTQNADQCSFHYVPWLKLDALDDQARTALQVFERHIAEAKTTSVIEVDLSPGELVFVDNHRIMHGRAAITSNSARNLKRFWIRSERKAA